MKLYSSNAAYIVEDGGSRLFCSKVDGRLSVDLCSDIIPLDAEEICDVVSVVGRIDLDGVCYLLLASECSVVGEFAEAGDRYPIYRIDRVRALSMEDDVFMDFLASSSSFTPESSARRLKQGTGKLLKFMQDKIGNTSKPFALLDEILRLFNEHPAFYFSFGRDITNSTQRHFSFKSVPDERFFWNRVLLKDLLDDSVDKKLAKKWIVPIVQGNVSCGSLLISDDPENNTSLNLTLISRRSIHRAGVRYLRRGIDCESNVANFVETELILDIFGHHLSFVQVRGSVPVFWSQKGFKYRPPLSIDKSMEESLPYFVTHIQELLDRYASPLVAVNLVDQAGRELKLATSYAELAVKMDCPDLYLVSFDLHRHCRGLKFEKINDLVSKLEELLTQIGYCWVDKTGEIVKRQEGIVRTNCVDCLDRTNIVQGAISQWVCMRQAQRLGLFGPLCDPPETLVTLLQNMWADNGDAISTQYAGTAALKGDVTRSGERRLAGIMRDGYNSASRYYLCHVRDSARQRAINALLSKRDQGSESMANSDSDSEEDENVCRLVAETIHFLLPEGEVVVGGWALCTPRQNTEAIDSILLLTRTTLYVAVYDDDCEKLEDVRITPLEDIVSMEIGCSSRSSARIYLRLTCSEHCWTWRTGRTRLFNNVAIRLRTVEEAAEYIESIAEQIRVTVKQCIGKDVSVQKVDRLILPGSSNPARKAFASVAAALKTRVRRPLSRPLLPAKVPQVHKHSEGLIGSAQADLIDFDVIDACSAQENVKDFRDDMNTNTAILSPQQIHVSPSDGCLVVESQPALSSGIVGRFRGLKPFLRTNDPTTINPFKNLTSILSTSRTNFIVL